VIAEARTALGGGGSLELFALVLGDVRACKRCQNRSIMCSDAWNRVMRGCTVCARDDVGCAAGVDDLQGLAEKFEALRQNLGDAHCESRYNDYIVENFVEDCLNSDDGAPEASAWQWRPSQRL
jgi:hypothetical protein